MASICNDPNGCRRILFVAPDGTRKTIRLGKCAKKDALTVKLRVESILSASISGGSIDRDTAVWLSSISKELRERLVRVGLVEEVKPDAVTSLGAFIDSFLGSRADLKSSTMLIRNQVRNLLTEHFGEDRDVKSITPGDADDWQQLLIKREMAPSTISKRVQVAKSYFRAMIRRDKITRNPFDGIRATASANANRMRFITVDDINAVIAKCPNHDWRMIVALARFGGLRTPSETLSLRWQDIDWDRERIVVTSPKTEHHEDGQSRVIPLFPELRPYLRDGLELAPDGAVYVVDERYRSAAMGPGGWANANLRTQLHKIIERAGLTPWPRLFQNLRSSRETELAEKFPLQVVTGWLGNSPKVALRHYLQITDEHFAKALIGTGDEAAHNAAQLPSKTAHNAAQQDVANDTQADEETPENTGRNAVFAVLSGGSQVAETGLEPVTPGL